MLPDQAMDYKKYLKQIHLTDSITPVPYILSYITFHVQYVYAIL